MQTPSGDDTSILRSDAPEEPPAQKSIEETVEAMPEGSTAKEEEQHVSEMAEEQDQGQKEGKEQTTALPRRERSVMFADTPQAATEFLKKEPSRLPSLRETRVVTATPQRSGTFSLLRKLTTELFSVPFGFFQSRAEVRTWGEEQLIDPSVQPRCPSTAHYGWGSLPNYPKSSLFFLQPRDPGRRPPQFYSLAPKGGYRPAPGVPVLQFVPTPVEIPQVTPLETPGYNWKDLKEYRMDTVPYVNARMTPGDPSGMYVGGNHLVAYPYGVPAVEENEANSFISAIPETCKCNFLCW